MRITIFLLVLLSSIAFAQATPMIWQQETICEHDYIFKRSRDFQLGANVACTVEVSNSSATDKNQTRMHFSMDGWKPLRCFLFWILLSGLIIRVVLTLLRAYRYQQEIIGTKYIQCFWRLFRGMPVKEIGIAMEKEKEHYRGDYLAPFLLGVIELAAYAVLLAEGFQIYIGAWISLKMLAQYKHWSEDPNKFNMFLLGNALVLLAAFTLYLTRYTPH